MFASSQKILTRKENEQTWAEMRDINKGVEEKKKKQSRSKTHGRNNTIRTGK